MPGTETSPIYGLDIWAGPQAAPWIVENTVQRAFEALLRGSVADRDIADAPANCDDGAAFLVAADSTGGDPWDGHAGEMAVAVGVDAVNGWLFLPVATDGSLLWVEDEQALIQRKGGAWEAFVSGGGSSGTPVSIQTGTAYTLALADADSVIRLTSTDPITITAPNNTSVAIPIGAFVEIHQANTGIASFTGESGVAVDARDGLLSTAGQFAVVGLRKVATNKWVLTGDLA